MPGRSLKSAREKGLRGKTPPPPIDPGGGSSDYYEGESANVSRLLDSLLRGYDKRLRPNYKG